MYPLLIAITFLKCVKTEIKLHEVLQFGITVAAMDAGRVYFTFRGRSLCEGRLANIDNKEEI